MSPLSKTRKIEYDSISSWFLNNAPPADNSDIGRELAKAMVRQLRKDFHGTPNMVLIGYLNGWNNRSCSPHEYSFLVRLLHDIPDITESPKGSTKNTNIQKNPLFE